MTSTLLPDVHAHADATLLTLLARARGANTGVHLYDRRGNSATFVPWSTLVERAASFARWARDRGVAPGDAVMVSLPTSIEFLVAWFGAAIAGARPLALAMPRALGGEAAFALRVEQLWHVLDRAWLVAEDWIAASALVASQPHAARCSTFPALDGIAPLAPSDWARADPTDVAFLQLTSGSTAFPKAVMIPHGAILANCRGIGGIIGGVSSSDRIASWLPLHHDMGLVGMLLTALYWDARDLVLLRPETFLARPGRWLHAISTHRCTLTASPDFGYRYAVDRTDERERAGLDLSALRVACTGAETVWESTMDDFARAFGPSGFARGAFVPCYGMAETTLAATMSVSANGPRVVDFPPGVAGNRPRRLVSVGRPLAGHAVQIRDAAGTALGERAEGEVAVSGPSTFAGYLGDPAAAETVLSDGWVMTGDLGLLDEGELYITGRMKDIIKVDGVAIAAMELEHAAARIVDYPEGRVAAFGTVVGGRERPVLVVEVPDPAARGVSELDAAIRDAIARDFGCPLAHLAFVKRGAIPKTTSGKTQRREVRRRYEAGEGLDRVGLTDEAAGAEARR